MASSKSNDDLDEAPKVLLTSPSFDPKPQASSGSPGHASQIYRRRLQHQSHSDGSHQRHVRLEAPAVTSSSPSSVYMGSYGRRIASHSRASLAGSTKSPADSAPGTPRTSMSHTHLEDLLHNLNVDVETYGVEELRDGFFDAFFFKPPRTDHEALMRDAEYTLPIAFRKKRPLSLSNFLPKQWHSIKSVFRSVTTTRAGVKLTKSFLGFFIAYILCLVPAISEWVGRYSYIMVLSALLNHPGRSVGSQIDGTILTVVGTATGRNSSLCPCPEPPDFIGWEATSAPSSLPAPSSSKEHGSNSFYRSGLGRVCSLALGFDWTC